MASLFNNRPGWLGARPGRSENKSRMVGGQAWTVGELGQNGQGLGLDGWRTSPEWSENKSRMVGGQAWTVGDLGQNCLGLGFDSWRTSPEWLGNQARGLLNAQSVKKRSFKLCPPKKMTNQTSTKKRPPKKMTNQTSTKKHPPKKKSKRTRGLRKSVHQIVNYRRFTSQKCCVSLTSLLLGNVMGTHAEVESPKVSL